MSAASVGSRALPLPTRGPQVSIRITSVVVSVTTALFALTRCHCTCPPCCAWALGTGHTKPERFRKKTNARPSPASLLHTALCLCITPITLLVVITIRAAQAHQTGAAVCGVLSFFAMKTLRLLYQELPRLQRAHLGATAGRAGRLQAAAPRVLQSGLAGAGGGRGGMRADTPQAMGLCSGAPWCSI